MPRKIVDLSPTIGEDFGVRQVGRRVGKLFRLRERTEFEHLISEEPATLLPEVLGSGPAQPA